MKRAAETAARIANASALGVEALVPSVPRDRYAVDRPTVEVDGREKRALLERASRAALAADLRVKKVEARLPKKCGKFSSRRARESSRATSSRFFGSEFGSSRRTGTGGNPAGAAAAAE